MVFQKHCQNIASYLAAVLLNVLEPCWLFLAGASEDSAVCMSGVALCGMCRCFHRFSFQLFSAQCEGRCPAGSPTNVPAPTRERRGATNERPNGRSLFSCSPSGKMTRCTTRCIIFLLQSSSSSKSAMLVMTTGSSLPTLLILFELCCFFAFRFLVGPSTFSLLLFVFSLSFHPRCHNCCLHGCSLRCVRSRLWFICWYMYLFFASLCYSRCYSFLCSCFSVLCSYLLRCHCHW